MKKEKRVLSREEKMKMFYRQPTDHDWLFVLGGTEDDILNYVSIVLIDPGLLFLLICYVTGRIPNLFLVYLISDALLAAWWWHAAKKKRKYMEEMKNVDQEELLRRKIEELKELENLLDDNEGDWK